MELSKKQTATQSQKLMIFVLTMALYGLATLFTELIPSFQAGIVEFSVEYFLFIPLTLAMLFDPLSAALGAAWASWCSARSCWASLAAWASWKNF